MAPAPQPAEVLYFRQNMRYWRLHRGLTLNRLSVLTGMSLSSIAKIEDGRRDRYGASLSSAVKIARALEVDLALMLKDPGPLDEDELADLQWEIYSRVHRERRLAQKLARHGLPAGLRLRSAL
jgi:transcriptional regulator with XRE-family HTH domain